MSVSFKIPDCDSDDEVSVKDGSREISNGSGADTMEPIDTGHDRLETEELKNKESGAETAPSSKSKCSVSILRTSRGDDAEENCSDKDSEEGDGDLGELPTSFFSSSLGDDPRKGSRSPSAFQATGNSVRKLVTRWKSSRSQYREDYKRTLEVFHQACFYLGVFYLTHVWSTTNRIVQLVNNGNTYYGLIVMHSL
ncbi:MAG: hypothetical protein SGILL_003165 [Bacillariaceae sp.]